MLKEFGMKTPQITGTKICICIICELITSVQLVKNEVNNISWIDNVGREVKSLDQEMKAY